jgi:hemerythrin-like metal-binding protein
LQVATDADLPAALDALEAHVLAHFGEEDRWMEETGFPARECHVNEHAAVLQSVRGVKQRLAQGDVAVCRRLALELAHWFPSHADYLDSALAHWMCKQRLGGKPVVVRRDIGRRGTPSDNARSLDR